MVQIVINSHRYSTKKEDLIYLDFQGNFESTDALGSNIAGLEIGDITLTDNSATLIIGHHRLVGKKVKLPKPFAVIHKKKKNTGTDDMDVDVNNGDEEETCFDVVTILKEKYVFSNRPGLIVQESLRGLTKIGKLQ